MTRRVSDTRGGGRADDGGAAAAGTGSTGRGAAAGRSAGIVAAAGPYAVTLAAFVGLLVVALITLQLFGGTFLPQAAGPVDQGNPDDPNVPVLTPDKTPSPSAPPVINDKITIDGKLVYAKAGNLWILAGTTSTQLTKTGHDSEPTWSPDGQWVYFIETRSTSGRYPDPENGIMRTFDLEYPVLSRIKADGTGREALLSGLYRPTASTKYYYFIKAPAVSPDGTKIAITSDGPIASQHNVVLQLVDVKKLRMTNLGLPEYRVLGHQDPAWSPDGTYLVYVRNGADGPQVWRYTVATKKARAFTDSGYTQPVYSPNGRYIAATKTNSIANDVVILDGRTGAELMRVTTNGRSWGPAWSPDGSRIAFMTLAKSGLTVDIHLASITIGSDGIPAVDGAIKALTENSGLDSDSRPAWWGDVANPGPNPPVTGSPGAGASGAGASDAPPSSTP